MSDIKPAMTADEWVANLAGRGDEHSVDGEVYMSEAAEYEGKLLFVGYDVGCGIELERPHKAAALALYGQPFGFTWDDVDMLQIVIDSRLRHVTVPDDDVRRLSSIADRIAALLPPRESPVSR